MAILLPYVTLAQLLTVNLLLSGLQWHRNEFESGRGGHTSGAKRRKFLLLFPFTFLALKYN